MALLDPSIPLQQRGLLLRDPLEMYAQVSRTRALNEESARRNQEQELQMQQVRQQMEDQAAERELFSDPSRFMRPGSPAVNPSEMDPEGAPAGQARFDPTLVQSALLQSRNPALVRKGVELASKGEEGYTLAPGAARFVGGRQVAANPSAEGGGSPLAKLIAEAEKFPPGHPMRAIYDSAIKKASENAPPMSLTVGLQAPYAGYDDQGNLIAVQPANRPGAQGQIVTDPRTNKPLRPQQPPDPNKADATKKVAQAQKVLGLLAEADKLIEKSTGSTVGRGIDYAAGVVGVATEGAKANAQLKVIQAGLMTNMPRMEGPQSDRDVALYREAAGQIGDPNVPAGIKRAAFGTIKRLNEQYAAGPQAGATLRYNPSTGRLERQ